MKATKKTEITLKFTPDEYSRLLQLVGKTTKAAIQDMYPANTLEANEELYKFACLLCRIQPT